MSDISVDIWTDIVCPWCYIGKRRFETALAAFSHRDAVRVRWRSFELEPDAPRNSTAAIPQRVQRDLGLPPEQAARTVQHVTDLAADVGLAYRLADAIPVNSFDAHRLMHLGDDRGLGEPVRERLMQAFTGEGATLTDHDTLITLAAEAGLDRDDVRTLLNGDDYADVVRADERRARALGVTGVPSFVFNDTYVAAGAQPVDVFAGLFERVWRESPARTTPPGRHL